MQVCFDDHRPVVMCWTTKPRFVPAMIVCPLGRAANGCRCVRNKPRRPGAGLVQNFSCMFVPTAPRSALSRVGHPTSGTLSNLLTRQVIAVVVILLQPPPHLAGASTAMERGRHQTDSKRPRRGTRPRCQQGQRGPVRTETISVQRDAQPQPTNDGRKVDTQRLEQR